MNRLAFGGCAVAALVMLAVSASVDAAHQGQASHPEGMKGKIELIKGQKGTRLVGHPVKDQDGRTLGKLADLGIASGPENRVYAVISLGGVMGVGPRRVAVPMSELDLSHTGYIVFTGETEALKDRPLFRHEGGKR